MRFHFLLRWIFLLLCSFSCNNILICQTIITDCPNVYAKVTEIDICANSLTVSSAAEFSVGDRVLIIQMKGAAIDQTNTANYGNITAYNSAGNYEFQNISAIAGNVITLQHQLVRTYDPNHFVQLVKVGTYNNLVTQGTITCPAWNAATGTGGVMVIEASGQIILGGNIHMNGAGFRGGATNSNQAGDHPCISLTPFFLPSNTPDAAEKGEGIADWVAGQEHARGKLSNGGGGGNSHNHGGGGGGNMGVGGVGGYWNTCGPNIGGLGGANLLYNNVQNKIFLGGGGGGGHQNNSVGANGGRGGGLIIIKAGSLIGNNNAIQANGQDGFNTSSRGNDGAGGGGAGGTILLDIPVFIGNLNVNVNGGKGGDACCAHGPGGGGAGGIIWSAAALPANVNVTFIGGASGIETSGRNSMLSTAGSPGGTLTGLNMPQGTAPGIPAPKHKIIANAPCPSDTLFLSRTILEPARPPYQYRWFTPNNQWINAQDLALFPPLAGKFVSELIDENYCIARDTLIVSLLPAPLLKFSTPPPCENQPLVLQAQLQDTIAPPYRFLWQAEDWQAEGQTATRFPPQAGTYTLTATNAYNCSAKATLTVELLAAPNVSLESTPVCANDTLKIKAALAGGSPPYSFFWKEPGKPLAQANQNLEIFPPIPGRYFVEVKDNNSCVSRDSIEVKLLPVPQIKLLSQTPCENQPLVLQAQLQDTIAPPYRFLWQAPGWQAEGQRATRFPPQAATYTLTATNAHNCAASLTQNIKVLSLPVFWLAAKAPCPEDTLAIEAVLRSGTPPFSYFWQALGQPRQEGGPKFKRFPPQSGLYKLEVRDSGCAKEDSIFIEVKKAPFISFRVQDSILCAGKSATLIIESDCDTCSARVETFGKPARLEGLGARLVTWQTSGTFSPRALITQAGCSTVFAKPLEVRPLPRIATAIEETDCALETFLITALQGATRAKWEYLNYSWEKDIFSDKVSLKEKLELSAAGEYTFYTTAQNAWGCVAADTLVYVFEPGDRLAFWLPNVFTPNGDGVNDYLEWPAPLASCLEKIEIFDRWGVLVCVLSKGATNWNLTDTSGARLRPGVYFYLLTLAQEGRRLRRNGSFTVVY
jgi:gliding motility-associated-like protein